MPCEIIAPITKQAPGSKGAPETPWETEGGLVIGPEPPPCHEDDPAGSTQGPAYETWTDREYVYHAAAGAQLDEFILQIDRTGAPMYVLQDAGLNVVGLVDQSGDVIRQDTYAPYGEVVATDLFNLSFGHNQAGWKGLFFDRLVANALGSQLTPGGVGLYRARNRSYSPTLGQWLQRDPNATAQPILEAALFNGLAFSDFALRMDVPTLYGDGMNLFQLGRSNPIANDDPLGLFALYGAQLLGSYIDAGLRASDGRRVALAASGLMVAIFTLTPNLQWGVMGGMAADVFDTMIDGVEATMEGQFALAEAYFMAAAIVGTEILVAVTEYQGKTVRRIIELYRKGSITSAPLPPGGPGWDDILKKTWEDIVKAAKDGEQWARVVKKLLTDGRFAK